MPQGTIKDFDEQTRSGSVLLDDGVEVAIDRTSMEGSGLRYLRLGQRVKFEVAEEAGKKLARGVRHITFD